METKRKHIKKADKTEHLQGVGQYQTVYDPVVQEKEERGDGAEKYVKRS